MIVIRIFQRGLWLTGEQTYFLFFLGAQLDYISQFPLQLDVSHDLILSNGM